MDERFPLPKSLAEFYKTRKSLNEAAFQRTVAQLLQHNAERLFPHGAGSEPLLHRVDSEVFPQILHEEQNRVWALMGRRAETAPLENNGFIELGVNGMIRVRAPDDISVSTLTSDSQRFVDLLLKGAVLRRPVGSDSVRIISLGKATQESRHTDAYGRIWQIRSWPIPFGDLMLQAMTLPTPDGLVGLYTRVPTDSASETEQIDLLLLDYLYVKMMEGTLAQWQDYLARKSEWPKALEAIKIDVDPQRRVYLRSSRYELEVTPQLLKLSKDSVLHLKFGFFRDRERVVWDVGAVEVSQSRDSRNDVSFFRESEPPSSLPEGIQADWRKLVAHDFPYNSTIEAQDGETRISTDVPATADAVKIRYGLRVIQDGTQQQADMRQKLELLARSFKMLEQ